jgi:hypothetical protein
MYISSDCLDNTEPLRYENAGSSSLLELIREAIRRKGLRVNVQDVSPRTWVVYSRSVSFIANCQSWTAWDEVIGMRKSHVATVPSGHSIQSSILLLLQESHFGCYIFVARI